MTAKTGLDRVGEAAYALAELVGATDAVATLGGGPWAIAEVTAGYLGVLAALLAGAVWLAVEITAERSWHARMQEIRAAAASRESAS